MPKYKVGENGQPVYQDGKFVLILDDGSETPFDALGAYTTFGTIRKERDEAQSEAKAAKAALSTFGATDEDRARILELAKKAKAFDDKKLVEAGKVDEVVEARLKDAKAAWDQEKSGLESKVKQAEGNVRKFLISSRFATSKALEKTVLTPDLAEAKFGSLFDVEGDAVIAFRDGGRKEKLYSRADPSKLADFDEALSILISSDPNFEKWKAGTGATGGGAPGGAAAPNGTKTMQRTQFVGLDPKSQMEFIREGGKLSEAA